jgi:hypothetical protein
MHDTVFPLYEILALADPGNCGGRHVLLDANKVSATSSPGAAVDMCRIRLNLHFFPELLKFQGGSNAAKVVRKYNIPPDRFFSYKASNSSVDFYTRSIVERLDSAALAKIVQQENVWIYTSRSGFSDIARRGYDVSVVDSFPNIHVAKVTLPILMHKTRQSRAAMQYVVKACRR